MWFKKVPTCWIVLLAVFMKEIISTVSFECGVKQKIINHVIVRGQPTSPGDWPWHVAIFRIQNVGTFNYTCGGTLISEFFVLTADHCVRDTNNSLISNRKIYVQLGVHNLHNPNPESFQQHNVYQIHEYSVLNHRKNDIAILELATEVKFTNYVQPACLDQVEDLTGQFGTTVGWGYDESDELSPILKSQKMPVVSTMDCIENNGGIFRLVLDRSIFCAGYLNGTTVCNGDSGGGFHFERKGVWYVGGIVSFTARRDASTHRCHLRSYAGFTNVYRFLQWIWEVIGPGFMNKNSENNGQLPMICGRYLVNRIFGGTSATMYEFPWLARLLYRNKTTDELTRGCHGSLINKRYVLTSAFCALNEEYKPIKIDLGDYDIRWKRDCTVNNTKDCDLPVQRVDIESIISHPDYDSFSLRHNIALLRLDRNIYFEEHIQPICLPVTESLRRKKLQQYIATGWGSFKHKENFPRILQKATVRVIDQSECENKIFSRFYIGDEVICTGGNERSNTCIWDQGTPLGYPLRDNDRIRFVQYGITSASGCENYPSVYTYIPNYVDWILNSLKIKHQKT